MALWYYFIRNLYSLLLLSNADFYIILDYCGLVTCRGNHLSMDIDQMGGSKNYFRIMFLHEQSMSSNYFDIT